jgi:transposase
LSSKDITAVLGGWEGYSLGTIGRFEAGQEGRVRAEVLIELHPIRGHPRLCGCCGQACTSIHDTTAREVRDLPILDADICLLVHRVRVACVTCGPKLERLSWLEPYARVTTRLAQSVARLCRVLSIKHAAGYFDLDWKTVKRIDKAYLLRTLGEVHLDGLEQIAMDEFAIQKGHRYATVIIEPSCRRVLWVGRGHGKEDVRPFFALLGKERCARLRAVAMDMCPAFEAEVKANCPNAQIVYDLFHVVAKYGREVIDRVRVAEAKSHHACNPQRKLIKSSRWLLLRNKENIELDSDRVKLKELLAANRRLFVVYVLKDDLKELWRYRRVAYAQRFFRQWCNRAIRSRIESLKRFAVRLKGFLPGILSHCRYPLHTSVLEGINNKIKVIKRMAYGFRDDNYFFLKIRQAFPGVGR